MVQLHHHHHPISEASETSPFGKLTATEFYAHHSVSHSSEYTTNSVTGLKLFTQWWVPLPPTKIIGTLGAIHGYEDNSSWIFQLTAVHLAKAGFATCAIDYQGHGKSQGLRGYIPDINAAVNDCATFFDSFRSRYPESLPSFLYAESLGGAIALLIHLNNKKRNWDGLVLHGPMCNISKDFKPLWPLEHLSGLAGWLIPTWRVVPTVSLPRVSYKQEWKRKLAMACPNRGVGRPRAATGHEFMRVCDELQKRFEEVVAPLLIVQGGSDTVCDPACAKKVYERAGSKDKKICVYEGLWHSLTGEDDDRVDMVFDEIIKWLQDRARRDGGQESQS